MTIKSRRLHPAQAASLDLTSARRPPSTTPEQRTSTCPRRGIVPPYLLAKIAEADGDDPAALSAQRSLQLDARYRGRRPVVLTEVMTGAAAEPAPAAAVDDGTSPLRTICDAHGTEELPGDVVRTEGAGPTGDAAVDEAYDGFGATWRLYREVYGRDSLDGDGLALDGTVHYGENYDNAFWDGSRMVFGDGDGLLFNRFTISVDVIGHELTHGVTEKTAGLVYQGQPGALNESVSDVFGSLVKQRELGQDAASADWLIGAGLFTAAVKGQALRSMKAPGTAYDDPRLGKDPQPATMSGYIETSDDNGGVHLNSGIPNHAFYLAAVGIGGNAWEGAGRVWYDVLTGGALAPDADFSAFAAATVAAAGRRFGEGSAQQQAVAKAWSDVEVVLPAAPPSGDQPGGGEPPADQPPADQPGPATTVVVVRSGGFAGLRLERQLSLGDLTEEQAGRWYDLLGSGRLTQLTPGTPAPDRFVYRVLGPGLELIAAEQELPDDVRGLFDETLRDR
jgi:hypothetical protein